MGNPQSPRRTSRRQFLGLAGMLALGGSLSCVGGVLGYWLVSQMESSRHRKPVEPTTLPRLAQIKQIDRPPIITRQDWGALSPKHDAANEQGFFSPVNPEGWRVYKGDLRSIYRTVVIHHSVIYDTNDITTMRTIQQQHMDMRHWADLAYHFGVGKQGGVFEGRALGTRGTHVERFNTGSVGVVFLGDFRADFPTPTQLEAGRRLINWLALRLELTHLAGHSDFNDYTDCPGRNMVPFLAMLAASAGLKLGTGGYQSPDDTLPDQASG